MDAWLMKQGRLMELDTLPKLTTILNSLVCSTTALLSSMLHGAIPQHWQTVRLIVSAPLVAAKRAAASRLEAVCQASGCSQT